MLLRPPISSRPATFFPYATLFRSPGAAAPCRRSAVRGDGGVHLRRRQRGGCGHRCGGGRALPAVHRGLPQDAGRGATASRPLRPLPGSSRTAREPGRSEEHTSELQSLMRISYAVFCLKKKKKNIKK